MKLIPMKNVNKFFLSLWLCAVRSHEKKKEKQKKNLYSFNLFIHTVFEAVKYEMQDENKRKKMINLQDHLQ